MIYPGLPSDEVLAAVGKIALRHGWFEDGLKMAVRSLTGVTPPGLRRHDMTKTGPRDDTKLAAIILEWWPRSDWNNWPPSLESAGCAHGEAGLAPQRPGHVEVVRQPVGHIHHLRPGRARPTQIGHQPRGASRTSSSDAASAPLPFSAPAGSP
jgi:hypothetical protein